MEFYIEKNRDKCHGYWKPKDKFITFNRNWSTYWFNENECRALLAGEAIIINLFKSSKTGKYYRARVRLQESECNGYTYVGVKLIPGTIKELNYAEVELFSYMIVYNKEFSTSMNDHYYKRCYEKVYM